MLVTNPDLLSALWLQVKLVLVLIMSAVHGWFVTLGKRIDQGIAGTDAKRMRVLNEVPFLLLIGIVILVVVRPF